MSKSNINISFSYENILKEINLIAFRLKIMYVLFFKLSDNT